LKRRPCVSLAHGRASLDGHPRREGAWNTADREEKPHRADAPRGTLPARRWVAMPTRPTILIVDDELGVRESLRAILSQDCDVVTAASGEEALALVDQQPIDLVTLDLRMPGMGGIGVLEAVKARNPETEVLIVTGYGSFDTAVQGLRHHAFDYISKPFDSDQIRRLVQAALAKRTATQRLKAAPDNILATLSHEFRTPLNVIMGYSTMLREENERELSEEQRLALDRIEANSTALLSYVETLFYMVELDRGSVPTCRDAVPLGRRLAETITPLRAQAAAKGLGLALDVPPELGLQTDGDMLSRAVSALVENAVRYTERGEIAVQASPTPDGVAIRVSDTGIGMSDEAIAETLAVAEGDPKEAPPRLLGFGLRLVGRLVRILGGTLAITSSPGGTVLEMALPHLAAASVETPAASVA
jgi:signal transduction histidine kinase